MNFKTNIFEKIPRVEMAKQFSRNKFSCCLLFLFQSCQAMEVMIDNVLAKETSQQRLKINVGVVLNDLNSTIGKVQLTCLKMALSDLYSSNQSLKTELVLLPRDAKNDVVVAAAEGLDLMKNAAASAIIGPPSSMQARFLIELGSRYKLPIISFSATSPSLTYIHSPYFFRATHNDSAQVAAVAAVVQAFGWREVVLIYTENEFGEGILPYLIDALQQIYVRIPYRSVLSRNSTDWEIELELLRLNSNPVRVFIVHMVKDLGFRVFEIAERIGMMEEGYVWIGTNEIGHALGLGIGFFDLDVPFESMQGVLAVRTHVERSKRLEDFRVRFKKQFREDFSNVVDYQLDLFGLRAYDAAKALAIAAENALRKDPSLRFQNRSNGLITSGTDLDGLPVSQCGAAIGSELPEVSFEGMAGKFQLVDNQLPPSAIEVVNVVGSSYATVGYWTLENGFSRKLKSSGNVKAAKAKDWFVRWPGETSLVPKGWEVMGNSGRALNIAVPEKLGFVEFVKVIRDPETNEVIDVTGLAINVFKTALLEMPYHISYNFTPYKIDNISHDYTSMICQVYHGKFDGLVGDVTITYNRSKYVGFTFPYTPSGVQMFVPVRDQKSQKAWIFLQPMTLKLWLTSGFFFVFIGFIVWVLEHGINDDFRGPPSYQIGTMIWFSFSTMVYAHREKIVSNLSRFVVIVWVFVVLILTQSYTASLTSMMTVQRFEPTVTDINELIQKGEYVGYQMGSYVGQFLKDLKIPSSQLREYESAEHCDEMMSKGSQHGGIAAAFDDISTVRSFLQTYCPKYTMAGPVYAGNGFGFVFQKGSPLVSDFNTAILKVTQGKAAPEDQYAFQGCEVITNGGSVIASSPMDLDCFWGLFLIAGTASIFAFTVKVIMFQHEYRRNYHSDTNTSFWRKLVEMSKHFDRKDPTAHAFNRKGLPAENSIIVSINQVGSARESPIPLDSIAESLRMRTDTEFGESPGQRTSSAQNISGIESPILFDSPIEYLSMRTDVEAAGVHDQGTASTPDISFLEENGTL